MRNYSYDIQSLAGTRNNPVAFDLLAQRHDQARTHDAYRITIETWDAVKEWPLTKNITIDDMGKAISGRSLFLWDEEGVYVNLDTITRVTVEERDTYEDTDGPVRRLSIEFSSGQGGYTDDGDTIDRFFAEWEVSR